MTLANTSRLPICFFLACLGVWTLPAISAGGLLTGGRLYGPTTPSGYYVRLTPSAITMSHTQRPQMTVTVENAAGQPVDDVLVGFTPSEGTVTTGTSHTRGGGVTGTFEAAVGSDSPRTAFVVVAVEDVEITIFIDIVPAVFGR